MKKIEHKIIDSVECKRCSNCKQWKPLLNFSCSSDRWDNLQCRCKSCQRERKNLNKEHYNAKQRVYNSSLQGRFTRYKKDARKRHLIFTLTFPEFSHLLISACYYCGKEPELYVGIDRVNNTIGYINSNCVPCCSICNRMKNNHTKEEFIMKCKEIVMKQEVMSYCK